jgi:hypothetical protein
MIMADILYVYIIITYDTTVVFSAECFLAVLKIILNNTILWQAIPFTRKKLQTLTNRYQCWKNNVDGNKMSISSNSSSTAAKSIQEEANDQVFYQYSTEDLSFISTTVLLNNIILPAIAILIVSSNCFYNAFFSANTVSSSYSYDVCLWTSPVISTCLATLEYYDQSSYSPPFIYSYQCASQIIINYTTVFILMYVFEGFIMPFVKLGLRFTYNWLKARSTTNSTTDNSEQVNPGNQSQTVKSPTMKPFSNDWWLYHINICLPHTLRDMKNAIPTTRRKHSYILFDKNRLTVRLSSYFVVFLTYGLLFPPLAIIICFTVFSITIYEEIIIGRLLWESARLKFPWYKKQLERNSRDIVSAFKYMIWTVIPISSIMFAFIIFDTWGDESGYSSATAPATLVFSLPILILFCLFLWKNYSSHCYFGTSSINTSPSEILDKDGIELNIVKDQKEPESSNDVTNPSSPHIQGDDIENVSIPDGITEVKTLTRPLPSKPNAITVVHNPILESSLQ